MDIKIATLNLCLGLQQKKNLGKQIIIDEQIDVLCMQETEIKKIGTTVCYLSKDTILKPKLMMSSIGWQFFLRLQMFNIGIVCSLSK